jgi:hypothetical protein
MKESSDYKWMMGFLLALFALFGLATFWNPMPVRAQGAGMPIILNVVTSTSQCAWPKAYATVLNGMAVCPVNTNGVLNLALAINGGTFQILGGGGTTGGIPPGTQISVIEACSPSKGSVSAGWTAPCNLTVQ